jgi:hypothetical protein
LQPNDAPNIAAPYTYWLESTAAGDDGAAARAAQSASAYIVNGNQCRFDLNQAAADIVSTAACARMFEWSGKAGDAFVDDQGIWLRPPGSVGEGNTVTLRTYFLGLYCLGRITDPTAVIF